MMLLVRSLAYYRRSSAVIGLGMATACAALGGALLVGASVRDSLRDLALERWGRITHTVESARMFDATLAGRVARPGLGEVVPAIITRASVEAASGAARASRVTLIASDDGFWALDDHRASPRSDNPSGTAAARPAHGAVLNHTLARDLSVQVGDEIIIRMPAYSAIPSESLLGRRDDATRAVRVSVERVIEDRGLGRFALANSQQTPRNAYLPLRTIQDALRLRDRVNTLLLAERAEPDGPERRLRDALTAADAGLVVRLDAPQGTLVVESEQMVLSAAAERVVLDAAQAAGAASTRRVLSYLANTISRIAPGAPEGNSRTSASATSATIPYAILSGMDLPELAAVPERYQSGSAPSTAVAPPVWLNRWTAGRLSAVPGDDVEIAFFMLNPGGDLRTEHRRLRVSGIVEMQGVFADAGLVPNYPGIADARTMSQWDPPFPIDYGVIQPEDEAYWEQHRATPKAFLNFETGVEFWAPQGDTSARFGRLTSVRITPAPHDTLATLAERFDRELRTRLSPEVAGMRQTAVRDAALLAATPATDFGALFLGFSMFVIASAVMLATLLLRLEIERRARELGTLLAIGLTPSRVRRLLLTEIGIVAVAAAILGAVFAAGYAWLMLAGLRSAWNSAVGTAELQLRAAPLELCVGSLVGGAACLISAWHSLRRVRGIPATTLLRGSTDPFPGVAPRDPWTAPLIAALSLVTLACMAAAILSDGTVRAGACLAGGAALLAALVAVLARILRHAAGGSIVPCRTPTFRLALRNLARRPDRSLLTVALVACATFIIFVAAASRHAPRLPAGDRSSGHGGYSLWAEADVPVMFDLGRSESRARAQVSRGLDELLMRCEVQAIRRRPGDDASCLNLYKPATPALLGAPSRFVDRGGFEFSASLADGEAERHNPWRLLERRFDDGAIPVIGDANTLTWLLHLGLGDDLTLPTDDGQRVRLRVVAALRGSIFQSELLMSEADFLRLFPRTAGYGVLLVDTPPADTDAVRRALAAGLAEHGIAATPTVDRIAAFLAVEHTYLATFQQLGGIGFLMGTLGVVALLLRNVLERRAELALLAAIGFAHALVRRQLWLESLLLVGMGLVIGALAACLAVAPGAAARPGDVPWAALGGTLLAILLTAALASALAAAYALREPPLEALRGR